MAATTKDDLLALCAKEYDKLEMILDRVGPDMALVKDGHDTSIKDVVGHRSHWVDLFLGWYADGLAGRAVFFPAEGYTWKDLKRYNADLRARQGDLGWDEAREGLRQAHSRLVGFLTERTEHDLYGGPMAGANNQWTPGRWAEAAGPSHCRSAAKYVRARMRTG